MKAKKLWSIVLAGVLMLGLLAGCTGGGNPTPTPTPTPPPPVDGDDGGTPTPPIDDGGRTYNVGVSIYKFDDNFMTLYRQEIEAYFKTLETDTVKYKLTVMDGKGDMAEQTNQVDNFIAQGVDVMIINLVQSSSAATVTQKADAAGIPVVYINREPTADDMAASDNIVYVGADARQSGTYQGEIIANLPDKGDVDGDGTVRYVMIVGDPENVDAQYRTEFSIKALVDAGITVEKLFEQRGDWDTAKGQELAATALSQFGNDIDVIFCNNDGMALGAYQAIVSAGRTVGKDIYLVGVDALDEVVAMVKDGTMTGTVLNDHISQSHTAVDAAVRYVQGGTNEKYLWVDYQNVTASANNK
jgi:methyl-galactoside transport system substrate-binding protein